MRQTIKIVMLSVVVLLGIETAVPQAAAASPVLVQSRMQEMLDRSRRRQARLAEDRLFAAEEARIAAEAQAEAARRAQAEAQAQAAVQAQTQPAAATPEAKPNADGPDEAEVEDDKPQA